MSPMSSHCMICSCRSWISARPTEKRVFVPFSRKRSRIYRDVYMKRELKNEILEFSYI